MYVIFGNFGNNTIAAIRWAYERKLEDVYVVSVDTGWAADQWQHRVNQARMLVESYDFHWVRLKSAKTFPQLVEERGKMPTPKFQWCVTFLKTLPLLEWLDEVDPECKATVILGSRRCDARTRVHLNEYIEESEHYGERRVWYPLYLHDNAKRNALIKRFNFEVLQHHSLECKNCIRLPAAKQTLEIFDMGCGSTYVCGE